MPEPLCEPFSVVFHTSHVTHAAHRVDDKHRRLNGAKRTTRRLEDRERLKRTGIGLRPGDSPFSE